MASRYLAELQAMVLRVRVQEIDGWPENVAINPVAGCLWRLVSATSRREAGVEEVASERSTCDYFANAILAIHRLNN
jgi:hypothetical protein